VEIEARASGVLGKNSTIWAIAPRDILYFTFSHKFLKQSSEFLFEIFGFMIVTLH
jgi:hypothetical protein